ncbi:MAG: Protein-methionine-sulfoxide reductase heme-binding subunit MsrQ [Alphaproteobacteria bacterium MarineAlpha5_Bin9]|nr:MAG: Protein-methionine-sulfoxide reductase heme-binding subunit MsrQ [Alphaproteobacteria bacterium MarineAlpha5_Bin9]|tara:strand:+ start:5149 stop:5745 length:597 start_codon:yes stop_codon:yes gene_type:complete
MILSTKSIKKFKPYIFISLLTPSIVWLYQFIAGNLGINPIDELMDKLGEFALQLIILTLFVSSLSNFKILRSLQLVRRMIGLFSFFYIVLHFITYIFLDHFFNWEFILKDLYKRPFILLGFISFVLLIPLAITSNNYMLKKLRYKLWKNIHKLIYLVSILVIFHYFLLTKSDAIYPLIYLILILILLGWRLIQKIIKN